MIYLFVGDLHISSTHQFSVPTKDGNSTRLQEHIEISRQIADIIKDNKIDQVFLLGDILHSYTKISIPELITAQTVINNISTACDRYTNNYLNIIRGNHDTYSEKYSTISIFKRNNTIITNNPIDTGDIVFVPYDSVTMVSAYLNNIKDKENKIVLGHFDIMGSKFSESIESKDGVTRDLLNQFKQTFLGHIHVRQDLSPKIHYVGSPSQFSFADTILPNYEKGVTLYDTETNTIKNIPITVAPKWITITSDNLSDLETLPDNTYVRLILTSDLELSLINTDLQRFKGVIRSCEISRISKLNQSINNIDTSELNLNPIDLLNDFIDTENLENKEKYKQVGVSLL